jgi:CubicO group peptidase (beta-lactamase class C family)
MRLGLCLATLLVAVPPVLAQQSVFPGEHWMQYETPEQAGFSSDRLADAYAHWEAMPSAAYMVVYRGAVVVAWGDVERRYMCHSTRKSLLSGLIGAHVDAGRIELYKSLADLSIDDIEDGLTDEEKAATIFDLLRARSGVYRLAAYEPPQNPKPKRHSFKPGENWCYNNWDFNTLVTIFEQETGAKVFEEFERVFAEPLGMQDYRVRDGYYHYELEKSEHPAYPFRLSGRDMARFGLLYLNQGSWDGERVLSEAWVEDSRLAHSENAWGDGYGYMWWVSRQKDYEELEAYSARGVGNQFVQVLPGAEMVIVNRTNTFDGDRVSDGPLLELGRKILAARTGEASAEPRLVPLREQPARKTVELPAELVDRICRTWQAGPQAEGVRIVRGEDGLLLELIQPAGMVFDLIPLSQTKFLIEGYGKLVAFELDPEDPARDQIFDEGTLSDAGREHLRAGRIPEALELFERAGEHFPESATTWSNLAAGLEAMGDSRAALETYERALELAPGNSRVRAEIERLQKELERGE